MSSANRERSLLRRWRVTALIATTCTSLGLASLGVAVADAASYTQCNRYIFVPAGGIGNQCPTEPYQAGGARHTYKGGHAACNSPSCTAIHKWYVAYTSSNASSYKYIAYGYYGASVTENYSSNTQLLRGYIEPRGSSADFFADGQY